MGKDRLAAEATSCSGGQACCPWEHLGGQTDSLSHGLCKGSCSSHCVAGKWWSCWDYISQMPLGEGHVTHSHQWGEQKGCIDHFWAGLQAWEGAWPRMTASPSLPREGPRGRGLRPMTTTWMAGADKARDWGGTSGEGVTGWHDRGRILVGPQLAEGRGPEQEAWRHGFRNLGPHSWHLKFVT